MKYSSIVALAALLAAGPSLAEEAPQATSVSAATADGIQVLQTRKAAALESRMAEQLDELLRARLEREQAERDAPRPRALRVSAR